MFGSVVFANMETMMINSTDLLTPELPLESSRDSAAGSADARSS
jgi:hypothetical protein